MTQHNGPLQQALCAIDDIPDGGAIAVSVDPKIQCIVLRRGGDAWAYLNRCPHFSIPLDFEPGEFCTYDATHLMCAHHSAMFRFEDGHCVDGPCEGAALTKIDVVVRDGRVLRDTFDTIDDVDDRTAIVPMPDRDPTQP